MATNLNVKRYVLAAVLFALPLTFCMGMTVFSYGMQAQKMRVMDLGMKMSNAQMFAMDLADFWWAISWVAIPLLIVAALFLGSLPLWLGRHPKRVD